MRDIFRERYCVSQGYPYSEKFFVLRVLVITFLRGISFQKIKFLCKWCETECNRLRKNFLKDVIEFSWNRRLVLTLRHFALSRWIL